jgi:MoaA/NifB/PqqE/SkfB family radical SAM enzyme
MPFTDLKFVIDAIARNGFSVLYLTGGETSLYPDLAEAVKYAKTKNLVTSLTSYGSMSRSLLKQLRGNLDALSISVDNPDASRWDQAKHLPGISKQAKETIRLAKAYGMKVYAITFLNPSWTVDDVERVVHFVNDDLGVSFALSYPYISTNDGTFIVGGELRGSYLEKQNRVKAMVRKILDMKRKGADVATVSGYMEDVLRSHNGQPMRCPCCAGSSILTIDCNLDVYPCYRRQKLFNLRDRQDLRLPPLDNSMCDTKDCLINCFKESSHASRGVAFTSALDEFLSNPKFYLNLVTSKS